MNTTSIAAGTTVTFAPTGSTFKIANVTSTRVSWYVGQAYRTGSGKNVQKMAWTSLKRFQSGIGDGTYIIHS